MFYKETYIYHNFNDFKHFLFFQSPYSDHLTFDPSLNNLSPESMNIPHHHHHQQQEDFVDSVDPYYMENDEVENIMNYEEQIRHTQHHLMFLKDQQVIKG